MLQSKPIDGGKAPACCSGQSELKFISISVVELVGTNSTFLLGDLGPTGSCALGSLRWTRSNAIL